MERLEVTRFLRTDWGLSTTTRLTIPASREGRYEAIALGPSDEAGQVQVESGRDDASQPLFVGARAPLIYPFEHDIIVKPFITTSTGTFVHTLDLLLYRKVPAWIPALRPTRHTVKLLNNGSVDYCIKGRAAVRIFAYNTDGASSSTINIYVFYIDSAGVVRGKVVASPTVTNGAQYTIEFDPAQGTATPNLRGAYFVRLSELSGRNVEFTLEALD